jgi:hypothetical protein
MCRSNQVAPSLVSSWRDRRQGAVGAAPEETPVRPLARQKPGYRRSKPALPLAGDDLTYYRQRSIADCDPKQTFTSSVVAESERATMLTGAELRTRPVLASSPLRLGWVQI